MTGEKLTRRERQVLDAITRGGRTPSVIGMITGMSPNCAQQYLARLTNRGVIRRVTPGEYTLATPKVKAVPIARNPVKEETFIRPIPLHRLMGGR